VFHGGGGYDWNTVYNMPIWLRKYIFNQIKEHFEKENKGAEDAQNGGKNVVIGSDGKIKDKTVFQNQPQPQSTPVSKTTTPTKRPISYK